MPVEFLGITEVDVSFQACFQMFNSSGCHGGRDYASQCAEFSISVSISGTFGTLSSGDLDKVEKLGYEIANIFLGNGITTLPIPAHLAACAKGSLDF
jgi:hypothetical protein